jgi:TatD DNase family protein
MIFDSHAHYDDDAFNEDRDAVLASLIDNNIGKIVNVGASMESSKTSYELAKNKDFIYAAVGVHPNETGELTPKDMDTLKSYTDFKKVVAIGEIGLDYHWDEPEAEVQKKWFVRQLELAKDVKLPVIIHSREAAEDTYEIMKTCNAGEIGGVVHCFSYSKEMAKKYLDMGFYIGIGGVLTFKNARKLKEVAEVVPVDRILLETDCPYLAPEPKRGHRNDSRNLKYVVEALSQIKGISSEEIIQKTYENTCCMYGIK